MNSIATRANCFDASALVKLYVEEEGAGKVRNYFNLEPTKYTTPFCFYEALNVLKVKWMYRKELTKEQYLDAAYSLTAWYGTSSKGIKYIDFASPMTLGDAMRLADKKSLDLSDALQILSIKIGYFSRLVGKSKTIMVTGDKGLAVAARDEGLRVWYFIEEPAP